MSLIVDASVAVKWVTDEDGSTRAETIFVDEGELIAPDLILAEVGNALWKKFRRKWLSNEQVTTAMNRIPAYFQTLVPSAELAPRALALAIELDHPIYDCFYLALAERERVPIVSADTRLLAAARKLRGVKVQKL